MSIEWISTERRLPPLDREVDVFLDGASGNRYRIPDVKRVYVTNEGWYWTYGENHHNLEGDCLDEMGIEPDQVTHWRYPPKPPRRKRTTSLKQSSESGQSGQEKR